MTTKLDMGGICEERFEGFVYHQGASIRYERVEASNSCARTLILGFVSFIVFFIQFFLPLFIFYLVFYCLFSFFDLVFIALCFLLLFCSYLSMFSGSCGYISTLP
jgi:hypothetical protein